MIAGSRLVRRVPLQGRERALVKTILYRVLMVAITIVVAFAVTADAATAVNIGLIANVVKTLTYYTYERIWDRVDWGLSPEQGPTGAASQH